MERALLWAAMVVACVSCSRAEHAGGAAQPSSPNTVAANAGSPSAPSPTPDIAAPANLPGSGAVSTPGKVGEGAVIGASKSFDNLAIFPVTSKSQEDLGSFTTLDDALAKKTASVHEIGADGDSQAQSAQVNSLVIENKGTVPIYVLAGTIVKGGKQDRQIGNDFIVGANQTIPVDAYCVEHGRWTANRDGVATGGQFGVVDLLADSRVRAAGQYQKDQSEVWSKVAAVNEANKKQASSGTLMATVDAADITARRAKLAEGIVGYLNGVKPSELVVGFAYSVNGDVRSVRYFANHKLFSLFEDKLARTAAMDAITAQAELAASGKPAAPAPLPAAVSQFVDDIQSASVKEQRSTPALNQVDVRESKAGYGSSTVLKPPSSAPTAKPRAVSSDFTAH
jgi:hypothetical protein